MDLKLKATAEMVRQFEELLVNRRAYTVQSMKPHPGERSALLLSADRERDLGAAGVDGRHDPAASGRRYHDCGLRHQPERHNGRSGWRLMPITGTLSRTC